MFMKSIVKLVLLSLFILVAGYSCKNKKVRSCFLVDVTEWDTVDVFTEKGLFNRQAEKQCEAEVDHRDTLEQYSGNLFWCECDVKRE